MNILKKETKVPFKYIVIVAMVYMILPISIFLVTWTKLYIGLPFTVLLLFAAYRFYTKTYKESEDIVVFSNIHLILVSVFLALWVWSTGIGNFFVSAYDHPCRTAMFRDLVNYEWPVVYPETGNAFVYYLCYWMVPALFGKAFGWTVGNVALLAWTYIGVLIVYFILIHVCNITTSKGLWCAALLLFGWSGVNIVAAIIVQILNLNLYEFGLGNFISWCDKMYNGYSFNFYYRSNQDALMEIYNQTTPLWITTLLAYDNRKRIENYAFIGMCLFPFAPIPFLGILVLFAAFFVHELIVNKDIKKDLVRMFSVQNLLAIISIAVVFLLFFLCNSTTQGVDDGISSGGGPLMLLPFELFDRQRIFMLIAFWIFQFGIIAVLIHKEHKKDYLFYVIVLWLMVCPLIEFGKRGGRDFCMNASLPALFLLMCMTIKYVYKNVLDKVLTIRNLTIICALLLASMSAIGGVASELDLIGNTKTFPLVNDSVYTLSDKEAETAANFVVSDWENKPFFKYIAK